MSRNIVFGVGEWYHCFNRGVDKRKTFMDSSDYLRFQALLYLCNSERAFRARDIAAAQLESGTGNVYAHDRGDRLVDIGTYALMPNHYHLLLRERVEGGISMFMQRLGTAYTVYFNMRHERTGALFSGRFRALHVNRNRYMRRIVNYIHGNPAELFEPGIKKGLVTDAKTLMKRVQRYPFSSLFDYREDERPATAILSMDILEDMLEDNPSADGVLQDFQTFYSVSNKKLWITS
ncbi:MAG: transposase [Patescibacteria group bacterium]